MGKIIELPTPEFYKPSNAEVWAYRPDHAMLMEKATAWAREHRIQPFYRDRKRVHLALIDCQLDFGHPSGSLYVGGRSRMGAVEDAKRIASLIYRHLHILTSTSATFDTHSAFHAFFATFWETYQGEPLQPYREISTEDIMRRLVRPRESMAANFTEGNWPWLQRDMLHMTQQLEKDGKYKLYLWPPHCLLGDVGHALVGAIQEARMFHAYVRQVQNACEVKGTHPLREFYSPVEAEVSTTHDGTMIAQLNTVFLDRLLDCDYMEVAGWAGSHCTRAFIFSLLDRIRKIDPSLTRKVYLLEDCMSPVVVFDDEGGIKADFTKQAEDALNEFRNAGMHVVKSTEPIESWPDIDLAA
jgi:nicotinamidase-related amidase